MSLTSFLKEPEVRKRFRESFEVPRLVAPRELLASPLSNRYSLVGTAFDYLLRFYVQRLNKNAIQRPWVAGSGLGILQQGDMNGAWYDLDSNKLHLPASNPTTKKARRLFKEAQVEHARYLSSGKLTSRLLASTIHLAQLDVVYRAGYVDENLGTAYREDIQDLRNLISLIAPELFRTKRICLLNPTFGKASTLVEGADADLLIDDILVDIKTTKNYKLEPVYFYQLLGYVILHRLAGIGELKPKPKITKMAIYFSRHAHLQVFDLRDVTNTKIFREFVKWFSDRARQSFQRRLTRRTTGR